MYYILNLVLIFAGMAALQTEMVGFQRQFYAKNSRTTRSVQIRRYFAFIEEFRGILPPIPCGSDQVSLYATWLARSLGYSSLLNYLSGLNFFLKSEGATPIDYRNFGVSSTLRGIKRERGCAPRQATPLLPRELMKIFGLLHPSLGHNCWRAAVLCSFRGLLRKCQVTSSESTLRRKDFAFFSWGMLLSIRRSKTIQFKERVLEVPVARCRNLDLCAVHWTELHFREMKADSGSLAFLLPGESGSNPMTYEFYQATLKWFCGLAGLDPAKYSSHSLRRGGCTYLSMCGASIEELRSRGDWVSETVFSYLKTPLPSRILDDMRVAASLSSVAEVENF